MDIRSEPTYTETPVIDLDIMVPSGLCRFTLYVEKKDRFTVSPTAIKVWWNGQVLTFNRSRVDYWTEADRIIKTPVKPKVPVDVPAV